MGRVDLEDVAGVFAAESLAATVLLELGQVNVRDLVVGDVVRLEWQGFLDVLSGTGAEFVIELI